MGWISLRGNTLLRSVHTAQLHHHYHNIGGTFDLFDGHCDRQNGLHTHFSHQHNVCYCDDDGFAWYEWAFWLSVNFCYVEKTRLRKIRCAWTVCVIRILVSTCRKHSSGDLHSRLKTRKLLGVGETDDGDVHRSKVSSVTYIYTCD